ncbi:MAG: hypothetical protein JXA92_05555 [candidate division Zixibacteria bacterium]|nr:hypothetical protein [candidate division Zixibacteria bacterium]
MFLNACEKRVTSNEYASTSPLIISWTTTSVIYDPQQTKNGLSLLLFMNGNNYQCKQFMSQTLTDTAVVRLINESFNIARIDPLSDSMVLYYNNVPISSSSLAYDIYHITALPTTCVLNTKGEYITRWEGYQTPEEYITNLKYARDHY